MDVVCIISVVLVYFLRN